MFTKNQLKVLAQARHLIEEFFDAGIILVTCQRNGETVQADASFGNQLAVEKLTENYVEGNMIPEDPPEDGDEWKSKKKKRPA